MDRELSGGKLQVWGLKEKLGLEKQLLHDCFTEINEVLGIQKGMLWYPILSNSEYRKIKSSKKGLGL